MKKQKILVIIIDLKSFKFSPKKKDNHLKLTPDFMFSINKDKDCDMKITEYCRTAQVSYYVSPR